MWGYPKAVGKGVVFPGGNLGGPSLSTKGFLLEAPMDLKEGFTWSSELEICS